MINAIMYVSVDLYNTTSGRSKHPRINSLDFEKNIYFDVNAKTYIYNKSCYYINETSRIIDEHYIGRISDDNLTGDVIHSNNYAPVDGAGNWGLPVHLSPQELIEAQQLYVRHSFNILASDKISINRTLPDMRSESCRAEQFDLAGLPTASVIIVFHNEAWSTLMRTVMSVKQRSPEELVKQIILVDDASHRRYLGKELDDVVAKLDKVLVHRSYKRLGVVGARLMGARIATGDVLVFLDAHCEVTKGWLEPLLDRAGGADVFISPHIDIISEDTLAYVKLKEIYWGAFTWRLFFRWLMPSNKVMLKNEQNPSKPYHTPAMAGGLFAARKSLFWRIGGYDEGMLIWGAENLELSWRAWQCGARVEISPCSRVGHLFRRHRSNKYSTVQNSNLARAASVWMDEWAVFYFKFSLSAAADRDQQNVTDRVQLRKNLQCKSFKWYLENVWPQHFFPTNDRWFGRIRSKAGGCLGKSTLIPGLGGPAVNVLCGSDYVLDNIVIYTRERRILTDEGLCLELENERVVWKSCRDNSKKIWNIEGSRLKINGLCLTLVVNSKKKFGDSDPLIAKRCVNTDEQNWQFERVPWQ